MPAAKARALCRSRENRPVNSTKGKRACPALGKDISSAECGDSRNSKLACPPECAFNPFAPSQQDRLLELEAKLDVGLLEWIATGAGQKMRATLDTLRREDAEVGVARLVSKCYLSRDPDGLTEAQRWEKNGGFRFNNDLRALFAAKSRIRARLVEVHRVPDDLRVEVVDLLEPGSPPFVMIDRELAEAAVRFTTVLIWSFRLPHFERRVGEGINIELQGFLPADAVVVEIVRHLGGPGDRPALDAWLAENFARFAKSLGVANAAFTPLNISRPDMRSFEADYELLRPAGECLHRFRSHPAIGSFILPDMERPDGFLAERDWQGPPFAEAGYEVSLGQILVGRSRWKIVAFGARHMEILRREFEALMHGLVRCVGERVGEPVLSADVPPSAEESAMIPPGLRETRPFAAAWAAKLRDSFPDTPSIDLLGKTPREATRDPALRIRLVELLKQVVRNGDTINRLSGTVSGENAIDDILRELGLEELIFPPPPHRDTPPDESEDFDDPAIDAAGGSTSGMAPDRPVAPPLPVNPLGFAESTKRLRTAVSAFEQPWDAIDEWGDSGSNLPDELQALLGGILEETEWDVLLTFAALVWFGLVKPGSKAPVIDDGNFGLSFDREVSALGDALSGNIAGDLAHWTQRSPQPEYARACLARFVEAMEGMSANERPAVRKQPLMQAALMAIISELDGALRPHCA